MKSYFSIALLRKNPCEEKSLCKKLDEIEKMKNKVLRESTAKMADFALKRLHIAKYYDAKTGEQCHLPPKVDQKSVCFLPPLTKANEKQQHGLDESTSPACSDPRTDCPISKPKYRRSLSDQCLPLLRDLAEEKGFVGENKTHSIDRPSNNARWLASDRHSKPKCRRSLPEVVSPTSCILAGEDDERNAQRGFHAWDEKQKEAQSSLGCDEATMKPFRPRSISQCVAPKLEDLAQEISKLNAGTSTKDETEIDTKKEGANPTPDREALIKRRKQFQRRLRVATETPSVRREGICRWQQTVKLVKDLPKSEQAEILRGACFFRIAVPGFNSSIPAKPAEKSARQRKISRSASIPACRQELTSNFTALKK